MHILWIFLWIYLRPHGKLALLALLLAAISQVLALIDPIIFGKIIDGYAVPARWLNSPRMARVAAAITVALLAALTVMDTFASGAALVLDARLASLAVTALALWARLSFLLVLVLVLVLVVVVVVVVVVVLAAAAAAAGAVRWWGVRAIPESAFHSLSGMRWFEVGGAGSLCAADLEPANASCQVPAGYKPLIRRASLPLLEIMPSFDGVNDHTGRDS